MANSIKKNFVYQSIYQIMMVISPLITAPYLSRTLGPEKIGVYSFNYSIAYYFAIFAIMGLASYGNRAISRVYHLGKDRISKEFWDIFAVQTVCSLVVLFCYVVYIRFFSNENRVNATIEVFYVLSVCLDISWFYFGMEEFRINMIRTFFVRMMTIVAILIWVKSPDDLNRYTFIMAGGAFLASMTLWIPLKQYVFWHKPNKKDASRHIKPNIILFIPVLSLGVFHYMDKVMVGILSNMTETGYYTNADKVINIPLGLINALGVVMMPRISKLTKKGDKKTSKLFIQNSLIFSSWLGCAMCFGILAVVQDFVPIFFGKGYEACIFVLMIFSPVIWIKAVSAGLKLQVMIPTGKDIQLNISVISAAIANLILNIIFIPKYGAVGAVIGTAAAEVVLLLFYAFWSREYMDFGINIRWLLAFFIEGLFMLLVIRGIGQYIHGQFFRLVLGVLLGATVYLMTSVLLFHLLRWEVYLTMEQSLKQNIYQFLKNRIYRSHLESSVGVRWIKYQMLRRREAHYETLSLTDMRRELAEWYKAMTHENLDLEHPPHNFNQKIQWMKLYDNQPIKTELSDKYVVRDWIKKKIGEKYLVPIYGVWSKGSEIDFEKLPQSFVLKATHGSGLNLIVMNKDLLNQRKAKRLVDRWMCTPPDLSGFEQQYYAITRRIIAETYLEQEDGNLYDYKIHCFYGQPRIIQVIGNRNLDAHQAKEAYFDTEWNRNRSMQNDYEQYDTSPPKPECLNEMLQIAKVLSEEFDYVRVDLYLVKGEIKFGEMTFTPASGLGKWGKHIPKEWWEIEK